MLIKSINILTVVVFLAAASSWNHVSGYKDELALCSATEDIRCSPNMLPAQNATSVQENLLGLLRGDVFPGDGGSERIPTNYTVCFRYVAFDTAGAPFWLYNYFSCNVGNGVCSQCYDRAADRLRLAFDAGGCQGKDGAFVTVGDNCCLRYERYKLCPR